ncbi:penicillin-binding protein 2 [Parvularcula lutaonensis]|uniref:Beta-lactamase n=1 Tax=Parvularcula lutaonensis TaxID=491923 RepID=A0ABV7MDY0_9PROT|nr:penicillin-binding protein 2 [Parvularcula lutaonensis]GGY52499.1 peptidoglycan glycosyltransferase [Parvularcula lutaonensis]
MRVEPFDTSRHMEFTRRATLVSGGVTLLFGGVGYRLYDLQVRRHDEFRAQADENQFNTRLIVPLRGDIYDRYGEVIANNTPDFRVLVIPERTDDIRETMKRLASIMPLTDRQIQDVLDKAKRQRSFLPIQVAGNLDWDTYAAVNFHSTDIRGVVSEIGASRAYAEDAGAAFVVGYMGAATAEDIRRAREKAQTEEEADKIELLYRQPGFKIGKAGLERTLDERLQGTPGSMRVQVNAHGRVIESYTDDAVPPKQGEPVGLTIDKELQAKTLEILADDYGEYPDEALGEHPLSASAVVMDIVTGDVIVMASTPSFDPNVFSRGIEAKLWRELNESPLKPLLNKPVAGTYPPGSTFKLLTAIAAQEKGISPQKKHFCNGTFRFGGRDFTCWEKRGHGWLDMKGSIKHSCDVYYWNLATELDIDDIAGVAKRYGLGQTYDLGIGAEADGIVPSRAWKRAYYRNDPPNQTWFPGETLSVAIGQGAVTASPLQLAVMSARLATHKNVRPRLVRAMGADLLTQPVFEDLPGNPMHLKAVQEGMNAVVNEWGTAARSSLQPDYLMAGKTGTSQIVGLRRDPVTGRRLKNEEIPWQFRDHALFVAFAPYDNPRYACSVVVEHGGSGSRAAGPRARDIMRAVLDKDPSNYDKHKFWTGQRPETMDVASLGGTR